jgi:hypothetical protein
MPILGIMASAISGNLWAPAGAYDSISTATVTAGGQATITFSSIPATYTHLQLRATILPSATSGGSMYMQINSDTTMNYSNHYFYGTGSTVGAGNTIGGTNMNVGLGIQQVGYTGVSIIDILDYASTTKYKTVRALVGVDNNSTGGVVALQSNSLFTANGLSAVSSITLGLQSANFNQYSSIALYGIK